MEVGSDRPVSANDICPYFPGDVSRSSDVTLYLSSLIFASCPLQTSVSLLRFGTLRLKSGHKSRCEWKLILSSDSVALTI